MDARVCLLNRVSLGLDLVGTAAGMDTPPRGATVQELRLRLRLCAPPPSPAPGCYRGAGPSTVCSAAGTRRLAWPGAVPRQGSAGPVGATRRAQCACSLGACRLAGQIPASASRRLLQQPAPYGVRRLARDLARLTLSWNVVALGPNQSPGPAGPAERRGPAGQSAGRVPGGAWCQAPKCFRQVLGTDSTGTCEQGRPVAGLGSLLGASSRAVEPDGSRLWLPQVWRRARRS